MSDFLEAVERLSRDEVKAVQNMSLDEIRYLVETYYDIQENRISSANQTSELAKRNEPHETMAWLFKQNQVLEQQIKRVLKSWVSNTLLGQWLMEIVGIGPVIAAGLMAYTRPHLSPTVANLWSYAGLRPDARWTKGQKRPWNGKLKVLCWKIGQSFTKFQNHEDDVYGKIIAARREYEWRNNLAGQYSDQASDKLQRFSFSENTYSYHWYAGHLTPEAAQEVYRKKLVQIPNNLITPGYGVPMLPPAHIMARAQRYGVKLFLSHYHEVAYYLHHGRRPFLPFAINRLGHKDYIMPPNTWMFTDDWNAIPITEYQAHSLQDPNIAHEEPK